MADEDLSKLKIDKTKVTGRRGISRRAVYRVALAALVVILIFLYWKGVFTRAVPVDVTAVARIYPSQAFTVLNASGYVVPQRKAAVASKVTGRLVSLSVEEGSIVKKGEVIARLESDDVAAAAKQAAANLDVARANLGQAKAELTDASVSFDREKALLAKDFTTRASYDAADARYRKAIAAVTGAEAAIKASGAALQAANVALEYTLMRAPFNAVVLTKNADVGDIVTPIGAAANAKAAVVTVADMDSLQVEADVSESNLQKVKVGQPCEIQLDALPDGRFPGVIHMIVPTADRSKATVMVKVRFLDKDRRILPEMSARVAFLSRAMDVREEAPRTTVNGKAVKEISGRSVIYLIQGDRAVETTVETGAKFGDMVEILKGAKAGDKAVLNPPEGLKSGLKVKTAEQ
jgi:RND family efflux transporter MFP subunit